MLTRGLLLDCDGVLTEIELDGHLRAFNQVWAEEGVLWQWEPEEYAAATGVSGGRERLLALADSPEFLRRYGPIADHETWLATTARWHRRKTEILGEKIRRHGVVPRPGVRRLATEAVEAGWQLAVVSSGAAATVQSIARDVLGDELVDAAVVVSASDVAAKKPSPECYRIALDRCGLHPTEAIAIEDNANGLVAATGAGVPCVITVTAVSAAQEFDDAVAVLDSLGDRAARPASALTGSRWRPRQDEVCLADLTELAAVAGSAHRALDRANVGMALR